MKLKDAVETLVKQFGTEAERKHAAKIAQAFVKIAGSYDIHDERFKKAQEVGQAIKRITKESL